PERSAASRCTSRTSRSLEQVRRTALAAVVARVAFVLGASVGFVAFAIIDGHARGVAAIDDSRHVTLVAAGFGASTPQLARVTTDGGVGSCVVAGTGGVVCGLGSGRRRRRIIR